MNPSKRDEIMEQNIRGWYQNHQGRVIKCNFCRKDEPEDQEFGRKCIMNMMFIRPLALAIFFSS